MIENEKKQREKTRENEKQDLIMTRGLITVVSLNVHVASVGPRTTINYDGPNMRRIVQIDRL